MFKMAFEKAVKLTTRKCEHITKIFSVLGNKYFSQMPASIRKFSTWTKCKSVWSPNNFSKGHVFFFARPYMFTFLTEINRKKSC